jgi:autotransporter-associated beta strand protein
VDISAANVTPAEVKFSNSSLAYTLTGTSGIAGTAPLTKENTGTVTISNTNSFTGPVNLNGGTVKVGSVADTGTNSPLGAGSALNFSGGTLEFTGASGSTNRTVALGVGGGTVKTDTALTLSGAITGANLLTKTGSGTLSLTGTLNTYADTTVSAGTLQVGDGAANAGSPGVGLLTNNAALVFDHTNTFTSTPTIAGAGTLEKKGAGTLTLGGTAANTYSGLTTVTAGALIAGKAAGTNAIGGDLVINGGAFRYAGNNTSNQIPDTATVTVNTGGVFGDPTNVGPTNPGATDTIANLNIAGGDFGSGRNATVGAFTVTGTLNVTGGRALAQRGGLITANTLNVTGPGAVEIDGGSTTAGQESVVEVGVGGLTLSSGSIILNRAVSALTGTSLGSIFKLGGNAITTGTSAFVRQNAATVGPKAEIDLLGGIRVFNVTGSLDVGSAAAPIILKNGGLEKSGSGLMTLTGVSTYAGATLIDNGTLALAAGASIASSASIIVKLGATLDATASGLSLGAAQLLGGKGTVLGSITTTAGAKLSPGESIGTLTFGGSVDISTAVTPLATAALVYELDTPGASDKALLTSGILTIGAAVLEFDDFAFTAGGGFGPGNYVLFDTTQPVAGTLGAGTSGTVGGYPATLALANGDTQVVLAVIPEPTTPVLAAFFGLLLCGMRRRTGTIAANR